MRRVNIQRCVNSLSKVHDPLVLRAAAGAPAGPGVCARAGLHVEVLPLATAISTPVGFTPACGTQHTHEEAHEKRAGKRLDHGSIIRRWSSRDCWGTMAGLALRRRAVGTVMHLRRWRAPNRGGRWRRYHCDGLLQRADG